VVEWDAGRDDGYRGVDRALYREGPQSLQHLDDMARYHRVF
jgi:hypothetical protein